MLPLLRLITHSLWKASFPAFLALGVLTQTSLESQADELCPGYLRKPFDYSSETISQKLRQLPLFRDQILKMMEDPAIPRSIKRIIRTALEVENTTVLHLTREIRSAYGIPENFRAGQISMDRGFTFMSDQPSSSATSPSSRTSSGKRTVNEEGTARVEKANGEITDEHTVFVQNRYIREDVNDLISLIHELSHVRFDAFLRTHLPALARKFSGALIRESGDGDFMIYRQFYDYLAERYALQTEWSVLKSTHGKYFRSYYSRYEDVRYEADETVASWISDHVIEKYRISDPRVLSLRSRTLQNILLGE